MSIAFAITRLYHIDKTYGKAYATDIMTTVSATKARANFYDLIDEVFKTGKPIGITKLGVIKAVMVSVKEYDRMMGKIYGNKK